MVNIISSSRAISTAHSIIDLHFVRDHIMPQPTFLYVVRLYVIAYNFLPVSHIIYSFTHFLIYLFFALGSPAGANAVIDLQFRRQNYYFISKYIARNDGLLVLTGYITQKSRYFLRYFPKSTRNYIHFGKYQYKITLFLPKSHFFLAHFGNYSYLRSDLKKNLLQRLVSLMDCIAV